MRVWLFFLMVIASAVMGNAQTYYGAGGPIRDDGQHSDFIIDVQGLVQENLTPAYGLDSVCVTLTHSWVSDLDIRLITPFGQNIMLFAAQGGDTDSIRSACFSMDAPIHIIDGVPPYAGLYRPYTNLGNANRDSIGTGAWTLRILDTYAFADAGEMQSWSLHFGTDVASPDPAFVTALPIFKMYTDNLTIPNEPKIAGTVQVLYDESGGLNSSEQLPSFESHMAIEVRGSSSQSFPKKSFSFELQDEEGEDLETELLGLPEEEDWILYAPYTDKSMIRDALTYHLGNIIGTYAPRTYPVELFLNDDYHGIYWLEEKIKRDKNRVDIKKLDPEDISGDDLTGGYILKVDRDDGPGTYFVSQHEGSFAEEEVKIVYEDPEGPDLVPEQRSYIEGLFHDFENALYGDAFADPLLGYRRYVDVRSVIDFFLITELGHNVDGYRLSTFFYKDRNSVDSLFHLGPMWDFNLAYGNVDYCGCQSYEGWAYVNSTNCGNTPLWWGRLMEDVAFRNDLRCRFDSLRENELSNASLMSYMHQLSDVLQEPSERNFNRWPILGRYVWPNFFIGTTYQEELNYMTQWVIQRLEWMEENIPGQCETVANDQVNHVHVQVLPNPASDQVFVYGNQNGLRVSLISTEGKMIKEVSSAQSAITLDIDDVTGGIYFLRIIQPDGRVMVEKLIVQ